MDVIVVVITLEAALIVVVVVIMLDAALIVVVVVIMLDASQDEEEDGQTATGSH